MNARNLFRLGAVIAGTAALIACGSGGGGGGGGTTAPPKPVLSMTPQPVKLFRFTWADVSGETEYRLLENPDGASGFSQVALIAADATTYDHRVFLPARINASYKLQACNSAGCTDSDPVTVSGTLANAVGYFKASNTGANDFFGAPVALSADGSTLAVGAPFEDSGATGVDGNQLDNSATNSGAVYVFVRTGTTWSPQAYIKASNAGAGDLFGGSVALSADGNTLAVGAPLEDSSAIGVNGNQNDESAANSGAAYVFVRSGTNWSQQAYIKASNTGANDRFGFSLALSADGNTLAVGAPLEASNATGINGDQSDNSLGESGAVYVFVRSGTNWSQQAYVKASNTGAHDWFGYSVALSENGSTLAVGAPLEDSSATGINGDQSDNSATNSGAVYVFVRSGTNWSQQAYVKASNTGANDEFGYSLALSADGNTLAVGAYLEDSGAAGINGNQNDESAADSGAVYVFVRTGANWSQQAYIKASNAEADDRFGSSLALSADGNTLAVGAPREDSAATGIGGNQADNLAPNSGAAYLFLRSGSTWTQRAYIKASNTEADDRFGGAVALAADGNTLAVSALFEDSAATGVGGNQSDNSATESGAVYLF